jgi:hypothetical protein
MVIRQARCNIILANRGKTGGRGRPYIREGVKETGSWRSNVAGEREVSR